MGRLSQGAIAAWIGNFCGWWVLAENDWYLVGAVLGIGLVAFSRGTGGSSYRKAANSVNP